MINDQNFLFAVLIEDMKLAFLLVEPKSWSHSLINCSLKVIIIHCIENDENNFFAISIQVIVVNSFAHTSYNSFTYIYIVNDEKQYSLNH